MKHSKSHYMFWSINIFLPLMIAFGMYMFIHQDYLFKLLEKHWPLFCQIRAITYSNFQPHGVIGCFIKYQLGDLLWAYSLEVAIVLGTGNLHKALRYGVFLAIGVECFQLFSFIHATFDIWDVIAQIVGVLIAFCTCQEYYKKQTYIL